jgi:hypothetical protein
MRGVSMTPPAAPRVSSPSRSGERVGVGALGHEHEARVRAELPDAERDGRVQALRDRAAALGQRSGSTSTGFTLPISA